MNKDNAKDYLPLVQALAEGKTIQCGSKEYGWTDIEDHEDCTFPHAASAYRIKPDTREIWVNHYADGRRSSHLTIKDADDSAFDLVEYQQVRYREVIE